MHYTCSSLQLFTIMVHYNFLLYYDLFQLFSIMIHSNSSLLWYDSLQFFWFITILLYYYNFSLLVFSIINILNLYLKLNNNKYFSLYYSLASFLLPFGSSLFQRLHYPTLLKKTNWNSKSFLKMEKINPKKSDGKNLPFWNKTTLQ